jgi:hypothetical protein
LVSQALNVETDAISPMVVGAHNDNMVPLLRHTTVSGISVEELIKIGMLSREKADEIISKGEAKALTGIPLAIKDNLPTRTNCDYSAIIGSVEIVDCVINHPSIWADKLSPTEKVLYHIAGTKPAPIYNWVLANPIKFPEPIPAKGILNFWNYPNILAEPEEDGGPLFCHCNIPVKEINQVTGDSRFGFYCRYCGGKWYK